MDIEFSMWMSSFHWTLNESLVDVKFYVAVGFCVNVKSFVAIKIFCGDGYFSWTVSLV